MEVAAAEGCTWFNGWNQGSLHTHPIPIRTTVIREVSTCMLHLSYLINEKRESMQ
jgi:hypothetical protein